MNASWFMPANQLATGLLGWLRLKYANQLATGLLSWGSGVVVLGGVVDWTPKSPPSATSVTMPRASKHELLSTG